MEDALANPVAAELVARGARARVCTFDASTRTVEEAADAAGCELAQIVKSLVFVADGSPVMVLVAGHQDLLAATGGIVADVAG